MNSAKNYLGKIVDVKIDRVLGSEHPKFPLTIYEVNYWYVPNTISWDWEELDVYVLWVKKAISSFTWKCIAIIKRNDNDDKLIVIPDGTEITDEEIIKQTYFQEQYFPNSKIIRK